MYPYRRPRRDAGTGHDTGEEPIVHRRTAAALVATVGLVGCAPSPAPVPVTGVPGDIQALAGEWRGEYAGDESGRSGSIIFGLAAGSDTAFGDVLMVPEGSGGAPRAGDAPPPPDRWRQSPDVLAIRFVQVREGAVPGAAGPLEREANDAALGLNSHGGIRRS